MYYVYILQLSNGNYYIGSTGNLPERLKEHKSGQCETTSKCLPVKLVCYIAFINKTKALQFEKYLKTGSGFAFRNRHLS